MVVVHEVRVTGPLAPYAEGLAGELARLGFKPSSARLQMQVAAHLSRWLAQAGLGAAALDGPVTDRYLAARRAAGYTAYLTLRALGPLLGYLRRLGVAPEPVRPGPATAAEVLDLVRPFAERHAADGGAGLGALAAGDVTAFLTAQSRRLAPKTAQRLATALRSLLRFWHLQGLTSGPLDRAVPKVANRRPGLPRPLEPTQVQAMLDSCDRAAAAGRRDLAMLTLMARMGLRAGEVAGLRLDDISWRAGEITVRGKGNRRDQLPLPPDAGGAMAAWLRDGRPATALDRSVFTRIKAPHQGLTTGGITMAVFAAGQRAGLGTVHAHRLRHSAATAMLSQGGSLTEIGQVLRHRRPMTTAIYAKADIAALRALARPWPGVS